LAAPSTVKAPLILTQAAVPGTWTKPAPKLLQGLVRRAGCDFAKPDGSDNFAFEFGSTNVWATTPELTTMADAIVSAITPAKNTVQRVSTAHL
jgi:hypothetical protein